MRAAGRPRVASLSYVGAARKRLWLPWNFQQRNGIVNSIIWLVGLVVIILAALSFFGLR